jgi:hypothetical protein
LNVLGRSKPEETEKGAIVANEHPALRRSASAAGAEVKEATGQWECRI